MAINLCFEAGPEIEQLVAEEEVQRNAARAGDRTRAIAGGSAAVATFAPRQACAVHQHQKA